MRNRRHFLTAQTLSRAARKNTPRDFTIRSKFPINSKIFLSGAKNSPASPDHARDILAPEMARGGLGALNGLRLGRIFSPGSHETTFFYKQPDPVRPRRARHDPESSRLGDPAQRHGSSDPEQHGTRRRMAKIEHRPTGDRRRLIVEGCYSAFFPVALKQRFKLKTDRDILVGLFI